MARIPVYDQQTRATGALGAGPVDRGLGALGQAAQDVAQDSQRLQQFAQQKREEQAVVAANGDLMDARSSWLTQLEERKQAAPPGAPDFTPTVLKDFDTDATERLKKAATPKARAYLKERLDAVRLGLQQDAMQFEAGAIVAHKIEGLNGSVDAARTAVDFRPQDFDQIAQEQLTAIAASGLDAQRRIEITNKARAAIATSAVGGMIRRNPYSALKELNNEKSKVTSVQALDFADRTRLRQAAESEIRSREADAREAQTRARQQLSDRVADAQAAYVSGIPVAAPPTLADFTSAYPADQRQEAERRYAAFAGVQQLGADLQAATRMTPAEQVKLLEQRKPTQVEGAEAATQAYGALVRHVAGLQKDLADDPAAYVQKYSQGVQAAAGALSQEPSAETFQGYAAATLSAQRALGVITPRMLTDNQAHDMSERLKPGGNGADTVQAIQQEKEQWGRYWPQALAEAAPKLNPAVQVIALGMDPVPAARLASVAALKEDDRAKLLPASVKASDLKDNVSDELRDFSQSMVGLAGSEEQLARLHDSTLQLATSYVAGGTSAKEAAHRAAQEVVLSRYDVRQWRGNTLRMPAGTNPDLVVTGLASTDTQIRREMSLRSRDVHWRTLPDDSGVVLEDSATNRPLTWSAPTVKATTLPDAKEAAFRAWMTKIGHTQDNGYRVDANFTGLDYDYRGYFDKHGAVDLGKGQHLTDEFKLPNHETFSKESRYATGEAAKFAGSWQGEKYTPGTHRPGELISLSYDELAQRAVNRQEDVRQLDSILRSGPAGVQP